MTYDAPVEPAVSFGAMSALKSGTAELHRQLERRLAGAERFTERERYVEHLARLANFHGAAEARWSRYLCPVLSDFDARRKFALLKRDLAYLGGDARGAAELPPIGDSAAALGAFYVLEGATLGGQHLLTVVERKLGLDADHGASYLASYGPAVRAMWARFGQQVETYCREQTLVLRAVHAARATFAVLEDCLCEVRA